MRKRGPARVAFQLKGATTGVAVTLGAGGGARSREMNPPTDPMGRRPKKMLNSHVKQKCKPKHRISLFKH